MSRRHSFFPGSFLTMFIYFSSCVEDGQVGYRIEVNAASELTSLAQAALEFTELPGEGDFGIRINLKSGADCDDCFLIESVEERGGELEITVSGGVPLGVQYGLYHALEQVGFRFFSPYAQYSPQKIDPARVREKLTAKAGKTHQPEMKRRGLHLHTLHPIESLFDFWLAEDAGNARRVIDWLIKQRGNFIQWVALNDIEQTERFDRWKTLTKNIIDYAHSRGVAVGLNTEVFASSSLQNALITDDEESLAFLKELPFDLINLSFGEFIGEDAQVFVDTLANTAGLIKAARPQCEVSGTVHVGNFENLRLEYQGEKLLYYFLVKYVPQVTPWVHTVMYYNLYEDAGGAYNHQQFDEHRAFLLERIAAALPAAYFPESAYWCAFDNSVPVYLPLYIRSRWLDMKETSVRTAGTDGLEEHVLFSSGWEWGYWQTDYLTLRMNYELAADWREAIGEMLEPLEKESPGLAALVIELADLQHEYLLQKRLAAYFAGEDFYMEAGHYAGIISQPQRVMVEEVAKLDEKQRAQFREQVITPLANYADQLTGLLQKAPAGHNSWVAELVDGLEIDLLRARYVHQIYLAVLDGDQEALGRAWGILQKAQAVVRRRHATLFYPAPEKLLQPAANPTIYHFGYLKQADTLCLWQREYIKAERALGLSQDEVPWCID